jgi:hypothetical protein
MTRLNAANNAQALLVGDITAAATSFYVDDASVFPAAPFLISIDDEIMKVGTVLGNLLSDIDRAQEGTTAAAHASDSLVENRWTAGMYDVLSDNTPLNNFSATTDPGVGDDSADGYSVGSRWINPTLGKAYTCLDATAGAAVWQELGAGGGGGVLNKYDAAIDPTANDDSGDGYSVGSTWINVTDDNAFVCLDATAGAAVWEKISGLAAHKADNATDSALGHIKIGAGGAIDANGVYVPTGFKVGVFTRDMSLASGTQAITGVGFTPRAVLFLAGIQGAIGKTSIGFQVTNSPGVLYDMNNNVAGTWGIQPNAIFCQSGAGNAAYNGSISTYDSDGFTIAWSQGDAITGTLTVYYLAIK